MHNIAQRKISAFRKRSRKRLILLNRCPPHSRDFCHKESRKITNSWDIVCVEDLDLHAQAQTLRFGKAVADNGFGMFRTFLQYKLEEQGKLFIKIDKWFPSTKTCHECGAYNPDVVLGQSVWVCPQCGRTIQRNVNAALNIRDEGLRMIQAAAC